MRPPSKPFLILNFEFLIPFLTFNFLLLTCSYADYAEGDGSPEFPFQIAEPNQLIYMSQHPEHWDQHFLLTADINLALADPNTFTTALIAPDIDDTQSWYQGTPFTGVFDGNSHTIYNLTIDTAGAGNGFLGLFGSIGGSGAEIKNLGLENVYISSGDYAQYLSSLCGYNFGGSISNCYSSSSITGGNDSWFLGGLCGENSGNIANCYTTGSVTGGDNSRYLGGLCGTNSENISNCYSTSLVTGGDNSRYLGGLCGTNGGIIINCYTIGSVSGFDDVGGLIGGSNSGWAVSSYWDTESSGQADSAGGTGRTTAQMKMASTYVGWGRKSAWTIDEGMDYPRLWWENATGTVITDPLYYAAGTGDFNDPYLIETAEQFITIGSVVYDWNKHFKLIADIDLSGYTVNIIGLYYDYPFTGTFDGNGHTISNFTRNSTMFDRYIGMFGYFVGTEAEIRNLGVINPNFMNSISGKARTIGSLVGCLVDGTIVNCYMENGIVQGYEIVGGLVGYNDTGNISNCHATGIVSVYLDHLGGLVGKNDGAITNCHTSATVNGTRIFGSCSVGGLVGSNLTGGSINHCYATGNISGEDNSCYFGGLVGDNWEGSINNCHAMGDISGGNNSLYLGGLCGKNDLENVTNCYASGSVTGGNDSQYLGGLFGYSRFVNITNCYATGSVTGGNDSKYLGGLMGYSFEDTINKCYAIGSVNSGYDSRYLGGLCGYNSEGNSSDCYASGSVTGGNNSTFLGGLCGTNGSDLINCYATGTVIGNDHIGGLCGFNRGYLSNCYTTTGTVIGDKYLGGLCGANRGSISDCYSSISVAGGEYSYYLGGLVGDCEDSTIDNCYAIGPVTGGNNSSYLGGLCGQNNQGRISKCYSTGSLTSGDDSISLGGLCGYNYYGIISNCYSIGSVGEINSNDLGGLCGTNNGGDISNCYSTGSVTGDSSIGGLCGTNYNDENIVNCYFLNTAGPDNGFGTPLTDPNMRIQSSFVNWDFVGEEDNGTEDHWQLCIDGYDYPRLAWQFINPADFLLPGRVDLYDLFVLTHDWLSIDSPCCDIAPADNPDGIVNLFDYIELSRYWLKE